MSFDLLEEYIKQYIEGQNTPEIVFTWHGGEPTILGLEYFEKVVELQAKYSPKHSKIVNDLQTNGTLLNDKWCQFSKSMISLWALALTVQKNCTITTARIMQAEERSRKPIAVPSYSKNMV